MSHREYLDILGFSPTTALSSLTVKVLKTAFKKKALERHPDTNSGVDKGFGVLKDAFEHLLRLHLIPNILERDQA